jgi:hypothetical protein
MLSLGEHRSLRENDEVFREPRPTEGGEAPPVTFHQSPFSGSAPAQPVYSTTMIESRSGAVSLETEEIVIVFEPC